MPSDETVRGAQALFEAGFSLYEARSWDAAAEMLTRALALDPGNATAWYRLGNAREEQGQDVGAASCFERAVALDPGHAQALNNLGAALQRLGRTLDAEKAYRSACRLNPTLREPHLNLGRLLAARGEQAQAAACYRDALAHNAGDPMLTHLLAAATYQAAGRAPAGYVSTLFDEQAARFDRHLVTDLGYRIPEQLAGLIGPMLGRGARVLDLGCGTGLVGTALAGRGFHIQGVDLSAGMLERAAQGGLYASLAQMDVLEYLERAPANSLDAIVAADVFIYIGDLRKVFTEIGRVLVPGGLFAFSIESVADGSPYRLMPSGRFSHSSAHLLELSKSAQLAVMQRGDTRIRREGSGYAAGEVLLLRREISRSTSHSSPAS